LHTLMIQCSKCLTVFSSGMAVSNGGTININNYHALCTNCGSLVGIPDCTFQETVEGIGTLLLKSPNPLQEVTNILEALEDSKTKGNISPLQSRPWYQQFKKWLPDSPEKVAAYIAIFLFIQQMLARNPGQNIEYSPTFIEQFNQTIIYAPASTNSSPSRIEQKPRKYNRGFGQYTRK